VIPFKRKGAEWVQTGLSIIHYESRRKFCWDRNLFSSEFFTLHFRKSQDGDPAGLVTKSTLGSEWVAGTLFARSILHVYLASAPPVCLHVMLDAGTVSSRSSSSSVSIVIMLHAKRPGFDF
jgi:hypothetical protein